MPHGNARSTLTLATPFSPDECRRRLEATTEADTFRRDLEWKAGILCRVNDRGFRLKLRHRILRNSHSRLLYGRWYPTTNGSLLELRPKMHPLVLLFTILWFGGVSIIGGVVFALGIIQLVDRTEHLVEGSPWLPVLMVPAMLLFGVLLVRSGRRDGTTLIAFVAKELRATPADRAA